MSRRPPAPRRLSCRPDTLHSERDSAHAVKERKMLKSQPLVIVRGGRCVALQEGGRSARAAPRGRSGGVGHVEEIYRRSRRAGVRPVRAAGMGAGQADGRGRRRSRGRRVAPVGRGRRRNGGPEGRFGWWRRERGGQLDGFILHLIDPGFGRLRLHGTEPPPVGELRGRAGSARAMRPPTPTPRLGSGAVVRRDPTPSGRRASRRCDARTCRPWRWLSASGTILRSASPR